MNRRRFFSGGLAALGGLFAVRLTPVTKPALAEGIGPLSDPAVLARISEALRSYDTTNIHVNVKGSVDHGTIHRLVQKINRKVQERGNAVSRTSDL